MKNFFVYCLIIASAFALGIATVFYWPHIFKSAVYESAEGQLVSEFNDVDETRIAWSALLPESDRELLTKYQVTADTTMTQQILNSIKAASDEAYKMSLISDRTVDTYVDKAVSISGFIVPIELNEEQAVTRFFLVPYFGACLHYPPPPPNQIIHAFTEDGFVEFDLNQPYTIFGFLRKAMFEDPLGTSAYSFDLVRVERYTGEPDDVRQH